MKKETEEMLLTELSCGQLTYLDIDELFAKYSTLEITCLDDLFRDHRDFYTFVLEHRDMFYDKYDDDQEFAVRLAAERLKSLRPISHKHFKYYRQHQEQFASEVENLVGFDKSVKILEVGSGEVPYSSILLGRDGYDITSMDDICLSDECLRNLHVKSNRQLFTAKTSVKGFDIVVGRRPCSAIENIVTNCSRDNVPYFMRLCSCNAPGRTVASWKRVLSSVDADISYKYAYAYNMLSSHFNMGSSMDSIIDIDSDKSLE